MMTKSDMPCWLAWIIRNNIWRTQATIIETADSIKLGISSIIKPMNTLQPYRYKVVTSDRRIKASHAAPLPPPLWRLAVMGTLA